MPKLRYSPQNGLDPVKLIATNAAGSNTLNLPNYVTVQNPGPQMPDAQFTASNTAPVANTTIVTFTDQSLNAPTSRTWSFTPNTVTYQNGTNSSSTNPQVTFNNPGSYSVKLVAANAIGADSITKPNYITVAAPQGPPVAAFSADITNAIANTTVVSLTDLSTSNPTSRYWSITPNTIVYQNNTNATSINPKLLFTTNGDYTIKLRVKNNEGMDSITKMAYIHVTGGGTAINHIQQNNKLVQLFPNPANSTLNFTIEKGSIIKKATLISLDGRLLHTYTNINNNSIDVSDLARGTYFLQMELEGEHGTAFKKFTKQ